MGVLLGAGVASVFALGASARSAAAPMAHFQGSTLDVSSGDCSRLKFTIYGGMTLDGQGSSFAMQFDIGFVGGISGNVVWQGSSSPVSSGSAGGGATGTCGPGATTGSSVTLSMQTTGAWLDDNSGRHMGTFSMNLTLNNAYPGVGPFPFSFTADFSANDPSPPPPASTAPVTTASPTTTTVATHNHNHDERHNCDCHNHHRPRAAHSDRATAADSSNAGRHTRGSQPNCYPGHGPKDDLPLPLDETVRPPDAYTNAVKISQMKRYGEKGSPSNYEEDHLIPLELGGAPRNQRNLWPEPHTQAKRSDPLEIALKDKVCDGTLTLAAARKQILAFKRTRG